MTERLYWRDPYLQRFTASVVEIGEHNGQPAVILDRTAFYPTGGGQPHDLGTLNGIPVVEVIEREVDGAILHILARPLNAREVEGHIDWERRFDHMQQHTGQHILSQAFLRITGAQTVSFHMGQEAVTIDLDQTGLPFEAVEAAEELANRVVLENREVRTWFVEEEDIGGLALRRAPKVEGSIRIVEVADFDRSACGGTHVRRTGEVGPIKILKLERRSEVTRVSFLCGWRALRDYQRKHRLLNDIGSFLSAGEADLPDAIRALQRDLKEARKATAAMQELYLDLALPALEKEACPASFGEVLLHVWPQLPSGLVPRLARRLSEGRPRLVILAAGGAEGLLTVACGPGVPVDAREVLKRILGRLDRGGGGGRPDYAQASLAHVDVRSLHQALTEEVSRLAGERE